MGKLKKAWRWKECVETKGLQIFISKTKMMVLGKIFDNVERTGKWHMLSVGWVLEVTQCSVEGVKGSISTIVDSFVCNVWERTGDGEDINTQESINL